MPAVLNAANEVAVAAVLKGRLPFLGIPRVVEETMAGHTPEPLQNLAQILEVNRWGREFAQSLINHRGANKPS
jgi:1-deoxy-D-xylulose-5-phosphate reductoisomerase